jgi:NAD(P)-dependent dehydrogenase (short-subunit alcohol dehydrogenase family)
MDIAGKVFIVTGGASGLGEGTARMLAAHGGKVVIADLQVERGEAVAQGDRRRLRQVRRQPGSRRPGGRSRGHRPGQAVGLVNCAGIAPAAKTVGKEGAHALALFAKVITVNLVGSFNMIRLAARPCARTSPSPPASAAC